MNFTQWIVTKFKESPLKEQREAFQVYQKEPDSFRQSILSNLENWGIIFVMETCKALTCFPARDVHDIFDEFQKYFQSEEFQSLLS